MKKSREAVIKEFKETHGDTYDYSLVDYINAKLKVKIICKKHGVFEQLPYEHKKGSNCSKCAIEIQAEKQKYSQEKVISDFKKVHGDTYSYSKFIYNGSSIKSTIICKKHGDFTQSYRDHVVGKGCSKCGHERRGKNSILSQHEFIERCKAHNRENLDFSETVYKVMDENVSVRCKKHGVYKVIAKNVVNGVNCKHCAHEKLTENKYLTQEQFLEKANIIHGDKYSYENSIYIDTREPLQIFCKKHKFDFNLTPNDHLSGQGCPKCSRSLSKVESEVRSFINKYKTGLKYNTRKIIKPLELDIVIPSLKIAIEFNGIFWHKAERVGKDYHLNKTERCIEEGYKLIHIFEDEWRDKKEIVKSRIKNIIGVTENKLFARKTEVKELSSKDSKLFLDKNHIQGNVNSKIKLGLYIDKELVSIMTFGNLRKSLGNKSEEGKYELLRFCNKLDTIVVGGASKLLKYFEKNYNPTEVISYADRRWSTGDLYTSLDFDYVHKSKPNYFYLTPDHKKRLHRYNFTKQKLVEEGFNKDKTEKTIMEERGYHRIYDCGTLKYSKTYLS